MDKKKKAFTIAAISTLLAASLSVSAVSIAKYVESRGIGQTVTRSGMENTSLFLNANIWTSGVDSSGNPVTPVYYMWVITGESTGYLVSPSKHVTPTVSGTVMDLYVFEYTYDWVKDRRGVIFIRANPVVAITSYTTYPSGAQWNQTSNIVYSSFLGHANVYNYFCITGWKNSGDGYENSGYSCNRIIKNSSTGVLTWG